MGKTSQETAQILNIQPSTVEQHRQVIKKKLRCKSLAEAVFKGMQLGYLIQPSAQETKNDSVVSLGDNQT